MNKKSSYFTLSAFLFLLSASGFSTASAYTTIDGVTNDRNTYSPPKGSGDVCLELRNVNLRSGSSDRGESRDIFLLQSFLANRLLLKAEPSGYYGSGTVVAVRQFQRENALTPTGITGPLTRVKLKEQTCPAEYKPNEGLGDVGRDRIMLATSSKNVNSKRIFKAICSYPAPPMGCNYATGPNYDTETNCGMILDCSGFGIIDPDLRDRTKSIACTMEMRYCPDGGMMNRSSKTCEWLGCSPAVPPQKVDPYTAQIVPLPESEYLYVCEDRIVRHTPCDQRSDNNAVKINLSESHGLPLRKESPKVRYPMACTMEMRFCPDGSAMPRGDTCAWKPEECQGGSNIMNQERPSFSSFSGTNDVERTRASNEARRLDQLMSKPHITPDQKVMLQRQRDTAISDSLR